MIILALNSRYTQNSRETRNSLGPSLLRSIPRDADRAEGDAGHREILPPQSGGLKWRRFKRMADTSELLCLAGGRGTIHSIPSKEAGICSY